MKKAIKSILLAFVMIAGLSTILPAQDYDFSDKANNNLNINTDLLSGIENVDLSLLSSAVKSHLQDAFNFASNIDLGQNSDYMFKVPVNLSKINYRVDKVIVLVELFTSGTYTDSRVGVGQVKLDVPASNSINMTVNVPTHIDKDATTAPEDYVVQILLKSGNKIVTAGIEGSGMSTAQAPYWAQIDENGQNSRITLSDYMSSNSFIGAKGDL
jgi:hypothetical protein